MPREDILRFLRDPKAFSSRPSRRDLWASALDEVLLPAIDAARTQGRDVREPRDAQIAAWRALEDQRLGLILGPPGTGKTFTLSWMALAYLEAHRLQGRSCRIMVTAFTRSAVMNVLESIAEKASEVLGRQVPVTFMGRPPETTAPPGVKCVSGSGIEQRVALEHTVVGCTTWGLQKMLKKGWHGGDAGSRVSELFDLVCVDEASQLRVPQALMGLAGLKADGRLLVAGDNQQLPPIGGGHDWASQERQIGGSVYDLLVDSGIPEQRLNETFRLNEPLSRFPSQQFYSGDYFSAAAIKDQRLALAPDWEHGLEAWQRIALSPDYPITVLLYDGPAAGTRNQNEVELVRQLVEAFWHRAPPVGEAAVVDSASFWSQRLAVVSPHRAQNAAIREALAGHAYGEDCVVETVDRIQGRERDAIIMSYTVADPEFAMMEASFLFSPQRFNVSLTRARSKFVLVVSRALLEVVPPDEELFDAARILREFIFECAEVGSIDLEPRPGQTMQVTLAVRRFDESTELPKDLLDPQPEVDDQPPPPPVMTERLEQLFAAIKRASETKYQEKGYRDVAEFVVAQLLARDGLDFAELRALQLNGLITLDWRKRNTGAGGFWVMEPVDPPRIPLPSDYETVDRELSGVVLDIKAQGRGPLYKRVRNYFAWVDANGEDELRPVLERLESEGAVRIEPGNYGELVRLEEAPLVQTPPPPPAEDLSDDDFVVLNALEDFEARRINFGVFEGWSTALTIADRTGLDRHDVADSLRKLDLHGFVMRTDEEPVRVRSRMAELARELRYVKQRFRVDDAQQRPYLVRSLKVVARNRDKPVRDQPVRAVFSDLRALVDSVKHAPEVVAAMESVLMDRWGSDACISGFQERSLKALLPAWFGLTELDTAVITADTGSGKTEAACLPLLMGAAVDALTGVLGTRAVLVYPRIRLATNQAQRLAGYLSELSAQEGMPTLTIGLQTGDVPRSWDKPNWSEDDPVWLPAGSGRWLFPFFACPRCDGELVLAVSGGPVDTLICQEEDSCGWSFAGWVGSKNGLRQNPPHIFLPVTESLHQWMQRPDYGRIFGDRFDVPGSPEAPRAVLADEIHLYSLVPGAQVGYTLQRLMARMRANGTSSPLAIGMSATLGDPARIWAKLTGRPRPDVLHLGPSPDEREDNVRGREYFYFVQPEVESRGHDIAGASTSIQALMCLAHGMRRRTGAEGGYRGIVFLDSIDKLKRLHGDYRDAEEGSRLARLRTVHQGATPRCDSTSQLCGGDPKTCDRFREGECWYFAATDAAQWTARGLYEPGRNLAVCSTPIFSGTRGNADEVIRKSDLVFSTSSLEVGFDDPDMSLVYQHYAPVNLASFVQRKGRGGRGADDRPVTGVTLSVYSPRDSWYFRSPDRMLDAADFEVPLNIDNFFVRRGQVLALFLDFVARSRARGAEWLDPHGGLDDLLREVEPIARHVFGTQVFESIDATDLSDLWRTALREAREQEGVTSLRGEPLKWGRALPQVPNYLFSPINLPLLTVGYESDGGEMKEKEEDVTVAFSECAPGKATRRWGNWAVHWNPFGGERAPLFSATGDTEFRQFKLDPSISEREEAARLLPLDARELLGAPPELKYVRPTRFPVEKLGEMRGRNWRADWEFDQDQRIVRRRPKKGESRHPTLHHKTKGSLLGSVIVVQDDQRSIRIPVAALESLTGGVLASYRCNRRRGRGTGLRVTKAYWGADVSLVLETRRGSRTERTTEYLRQVFTHSQDPSRPILFGYGMESEGICLELDSEMLDAFVDEECKRLESDADEASWLRAQFFRYLLTSRSSAEGLNTYQARQLADLVVSAASVADLRAELGKCLGTWSWKRFGELLERCYERLLNQSPVLTDARIESTVEAMQSGLGNFHALLTAVNVDVQNEAEFRGWLRSAVLHGLVIRLKQLFVLYGHGDERKVLFHASLPLQFGADAHDRITVCERGSYGDGTTRTFLLRASEAFESWSTQGGVAACPNARADSAVATAFGTPERHAEWRTWDPTDTSSLERLAHELGLDPSVDSGALQLVVRLLYGFEEVHGERFEYFDLYREIESVRLALRDPAGDVVMNREPDTWELVGAVVRSATKRDGSTPHWSRLLEVYGGIEDAVMDGSLSPQGRLADQVHRLSARLCPDGCQACLHLGSDMMSDDLAAMTVSRKVLERFWRFSQTHQGTPTAPKQLGPDFPWYSPDWASVLVELAAIEGVVLEPGGDVPGPDGRVVGSTVARVIQGAHSLVLVDDRMAGASDTLSALEAAGVRAVCLDPRDGSEPVMDALEG